MDSQDSARSRRTSRRLRTAPDPATTLRTLAGWVACLALLTAVPILGQAGSASPHGALAAECTECHSTAGWTPLQSPLPYRHGATGFDLAGAHADTACRLCHATLDFAKEKGKSDCFACHEPAFRRATRPSHTGFPTACKTCHGVAAWQPATFDHNRTPFPLNGAHRSLDCVSCHRNGYTATPSDCWSCHQRDFSGARNPVHAGFATSCEDCHGVASWQPAIFDHNQTGFQLFGAHRTVECTTCHRTGYAGTPSECFSCHQTDFTSATEPSHVGFPNTCRDCHGFTAWQPALFDHDNSGFPLTGAHRSTSCAACHRNGYAGTPADCFSCHQSAYNGARNPSHEGFPTSCQDCHGVSAWQPATFNHNATGFQLAGAHAAAACTSCHASGYAGTPADCVSCHQSAYNGARNPSHSGFPTSCQNCHSASAWQPASFDHNSTGFQLNGAHRSVACTSCHRNGYAGTPSDCLSCHQSDYNGASNPSHTGFPTTCQNCHSVTAWQPASFDHATTGFPLTGAHRSAACTSCHRNGYSGTPSACFSCHQGEYNATRNPNHATAGFPTSCEDCHGVNGWTPATFDHESFFPIASGRHDLPCSSCHVSSGNYSHFECVLCHEHSQGETNPEHREVGGYVYESRACYQCHPRGRE